MAAASTLATARRLAAAVVCSALLATALVVTGCGRNTPAAPGPPPDAGVKIPGDFSAAGPGTLVDATTMPMVDRRVKAVTSVAARIAYSSTSGITHESTEVTGTVFAPMGQPPEGGWPIIAIGHPTVGILPKCAPSASPTLMNFSGTILLLVKAGYVVTMSDLQGLGDARTYHPYLDATTAAYNLIDSVRAARRLVPDTSDRWVAMGISQGAQGSWAANELAAEYGSGLNLVGSVSLSPPMDISGFADMAAAGTLNKDQQPAYLALLATFANENPDLNLDLYRRGTVKENWDLLLQCDYETSEERARVVDVIGPDDLRPASDEATDTIRNHLRESSLPRHATTAPALVIYGGQDALIPPEWTDAALQRACKLGDVVDINLQPDKGHADIDVSNAIPWVADRFNGVPAPNSCQGLVASAASEVPVGSAAGQTVLDEGR
jgi:pimeloyl-ACP methyl ester carboxylesterase